jgi:hypothetical protein
MEKEVETLEVSEHLEPHREPTWLVHSILEYPRTPSTVCSRSYEEVFLKVLRQQSGDVKCEPCVSA